MSFLQIQQKPRRTAAHTSFWDADPTKVSTENGANAKPNVESWEEALRPSGTAVVDYSENVPSFKLTTGFYYNKGVSFRSGTTMFGQNNTPIAFTRLDESQRCI